jgi:hypothetical protein
VLERQSFCSIDGGSEECTKECWCHPHSQFLWQNSLKEMKKKKCRQWLINGGEKGEKKKQE